MFIDYLIGFDTVKYEILLAKQEMYGVRSKALLFLKDHNENRMQRFQIYNMLSDFCQLNKGVPQGSVLELIFFTIYINDFPNISATTQPTAILFADNTLVATAGIDFNPLCINLNDEIVKVTG